MASQYELALSPEIDTDAAAQAVAESGYAHIPHFLEPRCADRLYRELRGREDWLQIFNAGERLIELSRYQRTVMTPEQARSLDEAVVAGARGGFQYRYEAIRVPDGERERRASPDLLSQFALFLSSPPVLGLLQRIADLSGVEFADAQATAYSPGDFLTGHDDAFPGKHRKAAYVFGLTPVWRTEWGGLLLFHDGSSPHVKGLTPGFNSLNLFRVPLMHSVSLVSPAAAYRRYAITGWLRSGAAD